MKQFFYYVGWGLIGYAIGSITAAYDIRRMKRKYGERWWDYKWWQYR